MNTKSFKVSKYLINRKRRRRSWSWAMGSMTMIAMSRQTFAWFANRNPYLTEKVPKGYHTPCRCRRIFIQDGIPTSCNVDFQQEWVESGRGILSSKSVLIISISSNTGQHHRYRIDFWVLDKNNALITYRVVSVSVSQLLSPPIDLLHLRKMNC